MGDFYKTKPLEVTMVFAERRYAIGEPAEVSGDDVEVYFLTTAYMTDGEMVRPIMQDVFLGTEEESIATRGQRPKVRVDLDSWISKDQAIARLNKVIDEIKTEGMPAHPADRFARRRKENVAGSKSGKRAIPRFAPSAAQCSARHTCLLG